MESRSVDGFDGKLQHVSVDDIQRVYDLESQSVYNWHSLYAVIMSFFSFTW